MLIFLWINSMFLERYQRNLKAVMLKSSLQALWSGAKDQSSLAIAKSFGFESTTYMVMEAGRGGTLNQINK